MNVATRSVITNASAVPNLTTIAVRKLRLVGRSLDPVDRKLDHAGPKPDLDLVDQRRDPVDRKRDLDAMGRKVDRVGRRIVQSRRPRLTILTAIRKGFEIVGGILSPPPAAKSPRASVRGLFFCADQARGAV